MDFRPENALNLAKLGQFDQFFFTFLPSMYPQEEKKYLLAAILEKKSSQTKKKGSISIWKAKMT